MSVDGIYSSILLPAEMSTCDVEKRFPMSGSRLHKTPLHRTCLDVRNANLEAHAFRSEHTGGTDTSGACRSNVCMLKKAQVDLQDL